MIEKLQQAAKAQAVPEEVKCLSKDAKESLQAMVDYCLNHGIGMGMDEGFKCHESGNKHSFRLEIEQFCGALTAAQVKDGE